MADSPFLAKISYRVLTLALTVKTSAPVGDLHTHHIHEQSCADKDGNICIYFITVIEKIK